MQTQTFPEDIFQLSSQLEEMEKNADTIEKQADNIYSEYRTMMDAGSEYFSDPAAIFNGMLTILKDATCDSIKIAVATPITKSLMNKYLAAYPADHLENLGVVGGNDGISYWGSSILLDMQSVEVCAYYKMKIELPFLDLFEYQLKTTSSTRAWIGDGTHNDAKSAAGETSKTGGSSKTGRGVGLDEQATGLPGFGYNGNLGIVADGSVSDSNDTKGTGNPKEVNIHGKINSELDEVDLINKIIYEDKNASKIYMENPDFPQTEAQWAKKQIFDRGSNRINALQQNEFKLSGPDASKIPDIQELKGIKDYVFRIDADTPELRAAVQIELSNLKEKYPDYNFSATFGGNN